MTKDLRTSKEVKEVRELLTKEQDNKCAITGLEIATGKHVLEHAHDDNMYIRGVAERSTNSFLGVVENAFKRHMKWWYNEDLPTLLLKCSEYLSREHDTRWRHTQWLKKVQTKFNSLREQQKDRVLIILGGEAGKNAADRKKKFKDLINNRDFGYDLIQAVIKQEQESSLIRLNEQESKR